MARTKGAKNKPKVYIQVSLKDLNDVFKPEALILISGEYRSLIKSHKITSNTIQSIKSQIEEKLDQSAPPVDFRVIDLNTEP